MNFDLYLSPHTKIKKDQRSKCKAIKFLKENIGLKFYNFGFDSAFLDMTLKARQ